MKKQKRDILYITAGLLAVIGFFCLAASILIANTDAPSKLVALSTLLLIAGVIIVLGVLLSTDIHDA